MTGYQAYFNGEWMPEGEVMISPSDRGFTVGDLVFEVERTFNGRPFRLKEHIERLYRSLTYIRMDAGLSAEEMTAITEEAVKRAKADHPEVSDFWMRQIVTRGTVEPVRPARPYRLGASRRAGLLVRRPLRHGNARRDIEDASVLPTGARPQDQALQPG